MQKQHKERAMGENVNIEMQPRHERDLGPSWG